MPQGCYHNESQRIWENIAESIFSSHHGLRENGSVESEAWIKIGRHPQRYAYYTMQNAMDLYTVGQDAYADILSQQAVKAARIVLQTQQFDVGDRMTVLYDKESAFARGQAICNEVLHHGQWFQTGSRPLELWREAVEWYKKYFQLYCQQNQPLFKMMWRLIFADDYNQAIQWYLENEPKAAHVWKKGNPRTLLSKPIHASFIIALYANGANNLEDEAYKGTKYWYEISRDWVNDRYSLLDEERFVWVYWWHRFFSGNQDIRFILRDRRGY